MSSSERDKYDDLLGRKLEQWRPSPPEGMFERIEKSLEHEGNMAARATFSLDGRRSIARRLWRVAGVAAAVLLVAGVWLLVDREKVVNKPDLLGSAVTTNQLPSQTHTTAENDIQPLQQEVQSTQPTIADKVRSVIFAGAPSNIAINQESTQLSAAATNDDSVATTAVDESTDSQAEASAPINKKQTDKTFDQPANGRAESKSDVERQKAERFWRDILEEDARKSSRRGRSSVNMSLYAANTPGGTTSKSGLARNLSADLAVVENTVTSGIKNEMAFAAPQQTPPMEVASVGGVSSFKHRMPVSVGVNVALPISSRLSLSTGLNYTYLRSSATTSAVFEYTILQHLHYVGVPLNISWSICQWHQLQFYATGGGMLEKAFSGYRVTRQTGSSNAVSQTDRLDIKGFQPSVNAALGIMYSFTDTVGLYFEPGISYYFPMESQPTSYRSENPTNTSLRLGVRFNF